MATKLQNNSEFVFLSEDGLVSDFDLHNDILAAGEEAASKRAVVDAVRRGMSPEAAEAIYGVGADAEK